MSNILKNVSLYQGCIIYDGSFSTQEKYPQYHPYYVRTDYIDISNYNSVSIDILTENVIVYFCGLYDKNKNFIRVINCTELGYLQEYTYNKEENVKYVVFNVGGDGTTRLSPSDVNVNIGFSGDEITEIRNIKVGNSVIQSLYLGNNKVAKMYLGGNLIFGKVE